MFMLNDKPLALDVAFTTGEIQYPANWLRLASPEERAAIGITEVADPEPYDQRFYWGPGNPKLLDDREEVDQDNNPLWVQVLGQVDGEPVMVDSDERLVTKGLKSQWVAQVKDTAGKMLAASDWMVVRQVERGVAIPAAMAANRAAVIAECDRLEAAIRSCATVEELIDVVSTQAWPSER